MKSERYISTQADYQEHLNVAHRHEFLIEEPVRPVGLLGASPRPLGAWVERRKENRRKPSRPCQRTLIVGTTETGSRLAAELNRHFPNDFKIVGFAADGPAEGANGVDCPALDGTQLPAPILGTRENLVDIVRTHGVERIMFANCVDWQLENTGFKVRARQDRRAGANNRQPVGPGQPVKERRREVADLYSWATSPSFFWPDAKRARLYRWSKRSFDVALSIVALTVSAPLAIVIFPLIKLTSPGPIFYAQERVGRGGKSFTIYKLRTMRCDAEKDTGPTLAAAHGDTRSNWLGRLLRASKLDEIPQFWNVLKGEMSVVGPRPERPHFVEPFSSHIYSYALRHSVRPGLTGLAQIKGDHLTHVYIKLHYDLIYVCHRSFWLDVSLLVRTPITILRNMLRRP